MLPSPHDLQGFIQIVLSKNITKAAQIIGVTQPSLSQSLKRLEEVIGEQLVIRSKNGIHLTKAGEQVYAKARGIVEQWEELKVLAHDSRQEIKGTIKLGCHASVAQYSLGLFLPALLKKHQHIDFQLHHKLSRKILDMLIHYELDLALIINPIQHPDLILHKLCRDRVKIWGTKNANKDVLIYDPELMQAQSILKKLRKKKHGFSRFITSQSLEVITQLAIHGAGYAIIPERVVHQLDQKKKLDQLPQSPVFSDELYLASRVETRPIKSLAEVRRWIISAFKE